MSSPYLNNLIIIGCVLTYTSVILLGLDSDLTSPESLPYVCTVRYFIAVNYIVIKPYKITWKLSIIFAIFSGQYRFGLGFSCLVLLWPLDQCLAKLGGCILSLPTSN